MGICDGTRDGAAGMGRTACGSRIGRMAMSRALCLMNTLGLNVMFIYIHISIQIYILKLLGFVSKDTVDVLCHLYVILSWVLSAGYNEQAGRRTVLDQHTARNKPCLWLWGMLPVLLRRQLTFCLLNGYSYFHIML